MTTDTQPQKEHSLNGHERPLRIVETGRTILTRRVVVTEEEGSRAVDDISQHEKGGRDGRRATDSFG